MLLSWQGMFNNQRLVAPSANFKWKAAWGGSEVFVTGDFTAWAVGHSVCQSKLHENSQANEKKFCKSQIMTDNALLQELIPLRLSPLTGDFQLACSLPVRPCDRPNHFTVDLDICSNVKVWVASCVW